MTIPNAAAPDRATIEATIAALEAQRPLLGDAIVDVAVAPLRASLAALSADAGATAAPAVEPVVEPAAQSLKQVTIVFLDVVGSTSLSQRLDPEDIHALMDGLLAACTAIVVAHGGKVLQYAGDSLLAVFGADRAREDDAEQAVLAGLALVAEGRRRREAVRDAHGYDGFDVRVGAHTGGVLLGGGVDGDGSIRGMAVNIAARMEQTAPAGTLRISRDTHRQVRGLFAFSPQPPLAVKGIDEPVASYLVERANPRAFVAPGRGLAGIDDTHAANDAGALVGRDAELAQVTDALADAMRTRSLRLVTVVADAGLGKSRLLQEVERRLAAMASPPRLMHGRAQRHGQNVPHGVIRDMLAWHCGILDSDAPDVACERLVAGFGAAFRGRSAEQAALVGQLIGLDFSRDPHVAGIVRDGRQIRARAFHALAEFVRILCAAGEPVVVLLDDLHWADDGSLDLVEHLVDACADLPVLLGCFARPALLERRPGWGQAANGDAGPRIAIRIALQPFGSDDSERLLDALLVRLPDPPAALRALVLRAAEGNPFHIEELLAMLIDDGVVVADPDGWRVDPARLTAVRVPSTLTAVLQARLDALPPPERHALQHDSVIGAVFWDDAVRAIAPQSVSALEGLQRRELIRPHDASTFALAREYAFHHHLLHQVTYDTVLKAERRVLHGKIADWLVAQTGERIREHVGSIATHYERAGRRLEAGRYLLDAAKAAYDAATYGPALDYLARALALVDPSDLATRFEAIGIRMNVHNAMGDRQAQAGDLVEFERCADALGDDCRRSQVARWRALLSVIAGDYAAAIVAADQAIALSCETDDPITVIGALLDKAQALIFIAEPRRAEECLRAVLPLARQAGRREMECVAMNRLEIVAEDRGEWMVARKHLRDALAVARECGNRRFEGGLLGNLGMLEARLGHVEAARELLQAGLDIARAIGDRGAEPYSLQGLADIALAHGDCASAHAHAIAALEGAVAAGDHGLEIECRVLAGRCLAALGRFDEALACFDAVDADPGTQPGGPTAVRTSTARAELALATGRVADAVVHARAIAAALDAPGNAESREDVYRRFVCHQALVAAGAPDADVPLDRACAQLVAQIDELDDADRAVYMRIDWRRRIVAAAAARGRPFRFDTRVGCGPEAPVAVSAAAGDTR